MFLYLAEAAACQEKGIAASRVAPRKVCFSSLKDERHFVFLGVYLLSVQTLGIPYLQRGLICVNQKGWYRGIHSFVPEGRMLWIFIFISINHLIRRK